MDDCCAVCRTERGFLFECSECGFQFCEEHADPSAHRCPEYDGDPESDEAVAGVLGGRAWDRLRSGVTAPVDAVRTGRGALSDRVPSFQVGLPSPTLRVPAPNLRRPSPNLSALTSCLRIPFPSLRIPSPSFRVPSPELDVASRVRRAGAVARDGLGRVSPIGGAAWTPESIGEHSSRRAVVAIVLVLAVVVGFSATGGASQAVATLDLFGTAQNGPGPGPTTTAPEPAELEANVFEEINRTRGPSGGPALERSENLSRVAAYHSSDMAETGYAGVESPDGENVIDRFERFDVTCDRAAQMVLWVDGANATEESDLAQSIVGQWRSSEEHVRVLENEQYTRAGVGVTRAEDDRLYVSLAVC